MGRFRDIHNHQVNVRKRLYELCKAYVTEYDAQSDLERHYGMLTHDPEKALVEFFECDCFPCDISSKSCPKCGRGAVLTHEHVDVQLVHLTQLLFKLKKRLKASDDISIEELQALMDEAEEIARKYGERHQRRREDN